MIASMTGLCGWLAPRADVTDGGAQRLQDMIGSLGPRLDLQSACTPDGAWAVAAASVALLPDGLAAAIDGDPYWSASDLAQLAREQGHAYALAEAYRRDAGGLFRQLHGPFVLAVLDPAAERLIAAIDRIGQHTLYYTPIPDGLAFASGARSLRAHPQVGDRLSAQGIFNYVYFHMVPSPGCIYAEQRKLPGGHYLEYRAGRLRIDSYWQPEFGDGLGVSGDALGEEMLALVHAAVARAADGKTAGAFLSGGLDSSTIAGMLARLQPGEARTYSIGFATNGYDELDYARIAARHFRTRHNEYTVTPQDVVAAIPLVACSYDEPFGNSSAVPAYYCAKLAAADGITRMLAGDGGDELFAGNERYAKQRVFEHYHRLPASLRRRLLEPALQRLPGQLPLLAKARSYVRQANVPLPDRLQSYNFLHRHPVEEIFADDFLAGVDRQEPLRLQRERYRRPATGTPLERMLYLDWQQTLADNDLRKVSRTCALAGVEVAYPLLDDALVELSCRVPSGLKLKGRTLRHFYKQATRGFLPAETIAKRKHGFGLPFGVWMRAHPPLRELAYDSVLRLKKREYFRPAFIDRAIELHRHEHAAYYGELIWILMMLDLWLEAQTRITRSSFPSPADRAPGDGPASRRS